MMQKKHIDVDLDGTLAMDDSKPGEYDPRYIGDPVPAMVNRVKHWLRRGREVRIFTARVAGKRGDVTVNETKHLIEQWCLQHIGKKLPISNTKDFRVEAIYDDRAIHVQKNTGRIFALVLCSCGKLFQVPPSQLRRRKSCSRGCAKIWQTSNDPRHRTKNNQRWRERHPEQMKGIRRRYLYDVSSDEVQARFKKQRGLCAICKKNPATDLDHNHLTSKARGLLCRGCNMGLGMFKDSAKSLKNAAMYLRRWDG